MEHSVEDISPEELMEKIEQERHQEQQAVTDPSAQQGAEQQSQDEFSSFGSYSPLIRRFRRSRQNQMENPFSDNYPDVYDPIEESERSSEGRKSRDSRGRYEREGGRRSDYTNNRSRSNPNESQNRGGNRGGRGISGRRSGTSGGRYGSSQSNPFGAGNSDSSGSNQSGSSGYPQGGGGRGSSGGSSSGSSGSSGSQGSSGNSAGRRSRWYQQDQIPDYYQYELVENSPYSSYPEEEWEYEEKSSKGRQGNQEGYSNPRYKENSNMHYIENSPLAFNGGFGGGFGGFGGYPIGGFGYSGDGGAGLLALALAAGRDRGGYCGPVGHGHGYGAGDGNASAAAIAAIALGNRRDCHRDCDDEGGHGRGLLASLIAMDKLGDIEGSIPLAALGVQKAVADGTSSVNDTVVQSAIANMKGHADIGLAIANAVSTAKDLSATQTLTLGGLINGVGNAVDRNLYTLTATIKDDGDKTRALINSNAIAELNRIASERQDKINELLAEGRRRDDRHGIEINMINNQNQNQLQFQQQAQVLGQIGHLLSSCNKRIEATNQAINIGGTQVAGQSNTSNNTRVN